MVGSCTYSQLTSWILRSYSRNHSSDFHVCFLSQLQCSACHVVRERREEAGKNARQCSHSAAGLPDKQLCSCISSLELQRQRGQHRLCICSDTTLNSDSSVLLCGEGAGTSDVQRPLESFRDAMAVV